MDIKAFPIPNGGWNRVGLWTELDYGAWINTVLAVSTGVAKVTQQVATATSLGTGGTDKQAQAAENNEKSEENSTIGIEGTVLHATTAVTSANGKPVRVRQKPSTAGSVLTSLPVGTQVDVLEDKNGWCRIAFTQHGWMKKEFISGNQG